MLGRFADCDLRVKGKALVGIFKRCEGKRSESHKLIGREIYSVSAHTAHGRLCQRRFELGIIVTEQVFHSFKKSLAYHKPSHKNQVAQSLAHANIILYFSGDVN